MGVVPVGSVGRNLQVVRSGSTTPVFGSFEKSTPLALNGAGPTTFARASAWFRRAVQSGCSRYGLAAERRALHAAVRPPIVTVPSIVSPLTRPMYRAAPAMKLI